MDEKALLDWKEANTDAVQSRRNASAERKRADKAELQLKEMLAVREIKKIWDSILQAKHAFWQQVNQWIDDAKNAIHTYTESSMSLFSSEQESVISRGIVGEALKDGLDASDLSQRQQAMQNLLGQIDWANFSNISATLAYSVPISCARR